jgi:exodeoxyribonuclease VII large subunit
MNKPLSVSALNEQIKSILETTFNSVYIEGEISNLTYHNSGHIYFSIKDERSTISCVMFKGNAQYLKFRLEVGAKIVIQGNITVYAPRGNYQLLCRKIEPSGVGALALAYEQLKAKLQIKGYFDNSIKKKLPLYPNNIIIITSNTGAAIEDMKKILSHRYPLVKVWLLPTLVQGEDAKYDIAKNIQRADALAQGLKNPIIILGRGGGSIEDLWAFNEEIVADAIYNCKTATISAVGHENDFLISDFVADLRASTPSNAIEISTPNIDDLRQYTDSLSLELNQKFNTVLSQKEQTLSYLLRSFEQHSLNRKFQQIQNSIAYAKQQLNNQYIQILKQKNDTLELLKKKFEQNKPANKDKTGYVQLTKNNQVIKLDNLKINETITLENSKFSVKCKVLEKQKL